MGDTEVRARLETVIVFTDQMEALASFYAEGLGIGPFERQPGHLGCQLGAVYFGFDQIDGDWEGARSGFTIWFTVGDLDRTYERLLVLGARSVSPPTEKPWGATLASVRDPDGNLLGLSQRRS